MFGLPIVCQNLVGPVVGARGWEGGGVVRNLRYMLRFSFFFLSV